MKWAWDLPKLLALPRLLKDNLSSQVARWHPLSLYNKVNKCPKGTIQCCIYHSLIRRCSGSTAWLGTPDLETLFLCSFSFNPFIKLYFKTATNFLFWLTKGICRTFWRCCGIELMHSNLEAMSQQILNFSRKLTKTNSNFFLGSIEPQMSTWGYKNCFVADKFPREIWALSLAVGQTGKNLSYDKSNKRVRLD